jgi:hypothetical protein
MEYGDDGEIIAFSIRPNIASYVLKRNKNDLSHLKEIMKVAMYMNRLLLEGENLFIGKKKNQELNIVKGKDEYELDLNEMEDKDVNIERNSKDKDV